MLRVALAILALLSPALAFFEGERDAAPMSAQDDAPWVALDFALPASDAWVALALTAGEESLLDLRFTSPGEDPSYDAHAYMVLLAAEDDLGGAGGGWRSSSPFAQADVDGTTVACCGPDVLGIPLYGEAGSGNGSVEGISLREGQTFWVTLVAAHADVEAPPTVELRASAGSVAVGERREGTSVALVDLAQEARADGLDAQLLGLRAGIPGEADRSWTSTRNGFLFLHAASEGAASARLSATAAGETAFEDVEIAGERPLVVFARGPGAYHVRLTDVDEPPALPTERAAEVRATALYADLDVPGAGVRVYGLE